MNIRFFITGIGTGVGKTVVSAILVKCFQSDYWKPVQAGDLDDSDSMKVFDLVGKGHKIHPECFRLKYPASPHQSAAMQGVKIQLSEFKIPSTTRSLVIEGAGGLFVPLNQCEFMIDLIQHLEAPVVLVIRDYLGCINHTLLSLEALINRHIEIAFVVFNGEFVADTKAIILKCLPKGTLHIELPEISRLTPTVIAEISNTLKIN
ncbi:dethiobiotin synthase [Elizabethkingia argentiflava]|uniref:ATP-dependent dethiobiotin synthetase BioD n=1 Tax=Elizabethkingia argenteiflava TaxID=2681556 RepID=A0A845PUK4_9FLAO|nr:dethiobiotin synthase [Elizabethkingia argenteiflava]NAW51902.1 dethiobiotin synthase [Elizabethkingia argenteiflava]